MDLKTKLINWLGTNKNPELYGISGSADSFFFDYTNAFLSCLKWLQISNVLIICYEVSHFFIYELN
jgi:hypothetical protein